MNCAFCGEEFDGRPVRQNGQAYCSAGCADLAADMGLGESDYDSEEDYDDTVDVDSYEEADEY